MEPSRADLPPRRPADGSPGRAQPPTADGRRRPAERAGAAAAASPSPPNPRPGRTVCREIVDRNCDPVGRLRIGIIDAHSVGTLREHQEPMPMCDRHDGMKRVDDFDGQRFMKQVGGRSDQDPARCALQQRPSRHIRLLLGFRRSIPERERRIAVKTGVARAAFASNAGKLGDGAQRLAVVASRADRRAALRSGSMSRHTSPAMQRGPVPPRRFAVGSRGKGRRAGRSSPRATINAAL